MIKSNGGICLNSALEFLSAFGHLVSWCSHTPQSRRYQFLSALGLIFTGGLWDHFLHFTATVPGFILSNVDTNMYTSLFQFHWNSQAAYLPKLSFFETLLKTTPSEKSLKKLAYS